MAKVKLTQIKSSIDRPKDQKETLRALGLTKMHQSVEKETNAQILGMIKKVQHLLEVTDVK
ncbi:MAG: 50S ribosomal protein L30 [Flavobacteriales bacterium]|nr:50S ribosomal protein L30 [Flavobacteriales bacterium]